MEGWSGGTQIGAALEQLNRRYARDRVHRRTVVIVLSDGWDRGDGALAGRGMERLQRRAKRLIWLNPLLGQPRYRPLSEGMAAAALPFCDDFLPAHNVESLGALRPASAGDRRRLSGAPGRCWTMPAPVP